jgi:hypothetical protein
VPLATRPTYPCKLFGSLGSHLCGLLIGAGNDPSKTGTQVQPPAET